MNDGTSKSGVPEPRLMRPVVSIDVCGWMPMARARAERRSRVDGRAVAAVVDMAVPPGGRARRARRAWGEVGSVGRSTKAASAVVVAGGALGLFDAIAAGGVRLDRFGRIDDEVGGRGDVLFESQHRGLDVARLDRLDDR